MTTEWTGVKRVLSVAPDAVRLIESPICELVTLESIYLKITESSPDAMVVIDRKGAIVVFNQAAELLFDYAREDVTSRQVEMLLPPDRRERHVAYRSEYFAEPRVRPMGLANQILEGVRRDGSIFQIQIMLSPMAVPKAGTYVLAVVRRVKPVLVPGVDVLDKILDKKGEGM